MLFVHFAKNRQHIEIQVNEHCIILHCLCCQKSPVVLGLLTHIYHAILILLYKIKSNLPVCCFYRRPRVIESLTNFCLIQVRRGMLSSFCQASMHCMDDDISEKQI